MGAAKILEHASPLNTMQTETVFESVNDGILTMDVTGRITYANPACNTIFRLPEDQELFGKSFEELFLTNKRNKDFRTFYQTINENALLNVKVSLKYYTDEGLKVPMDIKLSLSDDKFTQPNQFSREYMLVIKDNSAQTSLKQNERDCAFIFSGLIICITSYLMAWKYIHFTLGIYLTTDVYAIMIEVITFLLFLEIMFMTSFSSKDLGLLPDKRKILKNIKGTIAIAISASSALLVLNSILFLTGHQVKSYFIGGSVSGALHYVITAFVQEFLARGVIQNCVKTLVKIKYQRFFCILLTSLLFSLMHMPFRFYFMMAAFLLSLVLGYVYEKQGDLWGCFFLHWSCGYLAMCLFF